MSPNRNWDGRLPAGFQRLYMSCFENLPVSKFVEYSKADDAFQITDGIAQ